MSGSKKPCGSCGESLGDLDAKSRCRFNVNFPARTGSASGYRDLGSQCHTDNRRGRCGCRLQNAVYLVEIVCVGRDVLCAQRQHGSQFSRSPLHDVNVEMRRAVRMFTKFGVDLIKLNLSGEEITPVAAQTTPMSNEEVAMAMQEIKPFGLRACAHARSAYSVKQCLDNGVQIIYHASYADEACLDRLEARKDEFFAGPGPAWLCCGSDLLKNPVATGKAPHRKGVETPVAAQHNLLCRGLGNPVLLVLGVAMDDLCCKHPRIGSLAPG